MAREESKPLVWGIKVEEIYFAPKRAHGKRGTDGKLRCFVCADDISRNWCEILTIALIKTDSILLR
jgi:hypothetical protein